MEQGTKHDEEPKDERGLTARDRVRLVNSYFERMEARQEQRANDLALLQVIGSLLKNR
ncbi:hypothetical protein [Cupriavidus metallidurans]|uniref:hypothetical protein n=1 Tax=Cupriavidus metallidurans TaxID=119219 RepID=UPI000037C2A9|nr:hypothetical protein [Cupriavidus metallidurans]QGS27967.1 hypothetical protein FOB83_03255 [Cupriavidus metallidurans]